ncbi:MAG TPA: 30S ribosomal protein S19 [Candidatus Nanoarchaeia archaeon]|nr:30S ribosomal protein S19 [Candidatus Nanoarchaeia archaeon]
MAKKIFTFRGKTLEELQQLTEKELSLLLPSKQRRKIKRGFTEPMKKLWKKIEAKDNVKTHQRDMIVMPTMVGKMVKIHTGKEWIPVMLEPDMIGCYLGELILTRKKVNHSAPGIGATKSSAHTAVK